MSLPVTRQLLFDHFEGNTSPLQEKCIEEWLRDPANGEFYYQCLEGWESRNLQYLPDTDTALRQYRGRLDHTGAEALAGTPGRRGMRLGTPAVRRLAAACVVLLVAAVVVLLGFGDLIRYRTYATRSGETRSLVLPDGSQVALNANSTLKVARDLPGTSGREVWLTGEAFFTVSRRPDRARFVVHTRDLDVVVLGTRFNVTQRRGDTRVVLSEGKVKLVPRTPGKALPVLMAPGDLVQVSAARRQVARRTVTPEHYSSWRENKLVFNSTPLAEVLLTIQDFYGVRVTLADPEMGEMQFTATLPNNDLNIVLKAISSVYGLEVQPQRGQIILQ
jgi:ferric-dicitrate binding protein FerR (iron transport regulator)